MKSSHCLTAFSFLVFILGLLANSHAIAASSELQATPEACGSTIEANLAAAQKSLELNGKTLRTAVACLIAATASLNEHLHSLEQGRLASGELRAPETDLPLTGSRR